MSQQQISMIRDPKYWKINLGLLPMPLSFNSPHEDRYVMLNGTSGNFCLDVSGIAQIRGARNIAWSSNVGHYVSIGDKSIEIKRWDTSPSSIERIEIHKVLNDPDAFHRYLEEEQIYGLSVVKHSIRVFRKLRAVLGQSFDGVQSLKAYLLLLASASESRDASEVSLESWQLPEDAIEIAKTIRSGDWEALLEELINGRAIDGLEANLSIVLTHAIGELFQEAHFEAVNIPQDQLLLEGFLPEPSPTKFVPKIKGVHFTPPALARALIEEALYLLEDMPNELSVFDPACGSGEFLREALRQIRMLGFKGKVHLIGWDISEAACDMARFSLAYEEQIHAGSIEITIKQNNSIENLDAWPCGVDLLLMNPPFVSWQDLNREERALIQSKLGNLSRMRMDLAYAFLFGAMKATGAGGVMASIVPASFLDSDSASLLRERMLDVLSPSLIARLGSHSLFSRSLVDTGLFVAKKAELDAPPVAFWSDHRSSSTSGGLRMLRRRRVLSTEGPIIEKGFSIYPNPDLAMRSMSLAPRPYSSWKLAQELSAFPRVNEIFHVRQGSRTGKIDVFVLSPEKYSSLPDTERIFFRPAVVNRSIRNGYLKKIAYVFYPYGESRIESEQELSEVLPEYYTRILLPNKEALTSRSRIEPDYWWIHREHGAWQVDAKEKIVSTYFGDAGSFAWDDTGEFVVVQGLGWIPKSVEYEGELPHQVGLAYLAFLNSEIFSELLAAFSNHVSGGQWNLSKKYVDRIPIPDLISDDTAPETLNDLANAGESIRLGDQVNWEHINTHIRDVLGLSDRTVY